MYMLVCFNLTFLHHFQRKAITDPTDTHQTIGKLRECTRFGCVFASHSQASLKAMNDISLLKRERIIEDIAFLSFLPRTKLTISAYRNGDFFSSLFGNNFFTDN